MSTVEEFLEKYSRGYKKKEEAPKAVKKTKVKSKTKVDTFLSQYSKSHKKSEPIPEPIDKPKKKKRRDTELEAIEHYIGKEESDAIRAEKAENIVDLFNILDNFLRPYYAVSAGIKQTVKEAKRERTSEPGSLERASEVMESGKRILSAEGRGLKREEKVWMRDIVKEISPETVKKFDEVAPWKLWGVDGLSIPGATYFLGEVAIDPLTYIPGGLFIKGARGVFNATVKGTTKLGHKTLGVAKTDAYLKKYADKWYEDMLPHVHLEPIFKRKRVQKGAGEFVTTPKGKKELGVKKVDTMDFIDDYIDIHQSTRSIREKQVKKAFTAPKRRAAVEKMTSLANRKEAKQAYEQMWKANDGAVDVYGDIYAKEMKMGVEDLLKFNKVDRLVVDALEEGRDALTKWELDEIYKVVDSMDNDGVLAITQKLIEEKGFGREVNKLINFEKRTAKILAKEKYNYADKVYTEAIKNLDVEARALHKTLKSDMGALGSLFEKEITNTTKVLKELTHDFSKFIGSDAAPQYAHQVKTRMGVLKERLGHMTKYGIDTTRDLHKLKKLHLPTNRINALVTTLEKQIGLMEKGAVKLTKKKLLKNITRINKTIRKELVDFKRGGMESYRRLGAEARKNKGLQKILLREFSERTAKLMRSKGQLRKFQKKNLLELNMAKQGKRIDKIAVAQKKRYMKMFNMYRNGVIQQRALKKFKDQRMDIYAKYVNEVPNPRVREFMWNARKILDDQAIDMAKNGFPINELLYAPRVLTRKSRSKLSKITGGRGTSTSFLKHRKFDKYTEYIKWSDSMGLKREDNLTYIIMEQLTKGDLAIAKKNLKDGMVARLGLKDAKHLPVDLSRGLDQLFKERMRIPLYSRLLNTTKFMLTVPNPAFHGRNMFGFPFLAATTAGMKAGFNPKNHLDAYLINRGKKGVISTPMGKLTFDEIRKHSDKTGYFSSSLMRGNMDRSFDIAFNQWNKKNPINYIRWGMHQMMAGSAHIEDCGRMGALVANLKSTRHFKKGMSKDAFIREGLKQAKKAMFDYNLMLSPADKMFDSMIGFWTFPRKNLPRQLVNMVNDPKQYAMMSRVMNKISRREMLSDEEVDALHDYEQDSLVLFGEVIGGVRDMTILGFTPMEEASRTINMVTSGDLRRTFGSRLTPVIGSFLDFWYGKDSFRGKEIGFSLPAKYTAVIPKAAWKPLGLTMKEVPAYRAGEQVGTQKKLFGDPNTIALITKVPIYSRQINDVANLVAYIKKGKTGAAILRATTGIRHGELDVPGREHFKKKKKRAIGVRKAKAKGAPEFRRLFVPKSEKAKKKKEAKKPKKKKDKSLEQLHKLLQDR
jgi:hypothetical protein